jgi:hypothetical protein
VAGYCECGDETSSSGVSEFVIRHTPQSALVKTATTLIL